MSSVEAGVVRANSVTGQIEVSVRGQDYAGQPVLEAPALGQDQDVTLLRMGRGHVVLPGAGYYAPRNGA